MLTKPAIEAIRILTVAPAPPVLSPNLSVRVQTGHVELVRDLAEDWRRLWLEDPSNEPFYLPEWTEALLLAFAAKAKLIAVSAWSDERLRCVLPLIPERSSLYGFSVRRLRFPANVHCCRSGMVCCPGMEGYEVVLAMWRTLMKLGGWDLLDFDNVVEENAVNQLAVLAEADGCRVTRRRLRQSLLLTAPAPADSQPKAEDSPRSSFESNLRRSHQLLEQLGSVTLRQCRAADPQALEEFYRIERSACAERQGPASACDPRMRRFYDLIAQAAARDGHLALDFLDLNGKPIAAHLGLNFNGRHLLIQAAHDETYRRFDPGHLLVHEILNQAGLDGRRELDLVDPTWDGTPWVSARRNHFRISIFRKGAYGSWLHFLNRADRRQ